MKLGNLNRPKPVLLAPLAGVSDRPFRLLAIGYGAAVTYTEMVSSEGIIRHQKRTLDILEFGDDERPIGVQLFGANPEVMHRATRFVADSLSPDLIDINLGCPVKKVVRKSGGAAILKDIGLTREVLQAAVEGAGPTAVTAKMRTGWDDSSPVYIEAGQVAQECGVAAITLHARSRARGYAGDADWATIKNLKNSVNIPVIGNGDIRTPEDAGRMLEETGCDAVMVGRAAMKDPSIFARINVYLDTGELMPEPGLSEKVAMALKHARLMASRYGDERGAIKMRRHLGWYVKGFPGASRLRPRLFQVSSVGDIERVFADYMGGQPGNAKK